jgi:hypothetical protein
LFLIKKLLQPVRQYYIRVVESAVLFVELKVLIPTDSSSLEVVFLLSILRTSQGGGVRLLLLMMARSCRQFAY